MMANTEKTEKPAPPSIGILVIGLGGYNGTTLVAGVLANRRNIQWHGPQGQHRTPNYNGCITQLKSKGKYGGVGFSNVLPGLASINDAAISGWDIRSTPMGDALLKQQILDYDLVRQVREEMNTTFPIMKGYFDSRFIGSKLHEDANHILKTSNDDASSTSSMKAIDVVNRLREDIRNFKSSQGVTGHTTVIWSASVEPNCELCLPGHGVDTAEELLHSLELSDDERGGPLAPSILYATAAALEGCSFVNGGSQNTIKCKGVVKLAERKMGVYILGTDFKAGQTKFKTAAVEYLRTMGLTPKVIASSNHLGNNDMKNLECSDKTRMAKLRVKHDIFAAWEEHELDHKVAVMYTPEINDEKRDFVEYTSDGFLSQPHTMVTYTRAMDSVLCVPLMLDAAVWCDFFSQRHWSSIDVSKALAYLFKVPEGGAEGVDPGFFRQMEELKKQAFAACRDEMEDTSNSRSKVTAATTASSLPTEPPKTAEWRIPPECSTVICAGLACVDMQLNNSTGGEGGEAIETFQEVHYIGGGSVSMACKTLARLSYDESPYPLFSKIVPLCKMGQDDAGKKLVELLQDTGSQCRNVDMTASLEECSKDKEDARTALSVLPIYQNGSRGCFFDAASNDTFSSQTLLSMVKNVVAQATETSTSQVGAFLFGYPHLLPMIQGEHLAYALQQAKIIIGNHCITALDLNGVPHLQSNSSQSTTVMKTTAELLDDPVLGHALPHVDILHMNQDELASLAGYPLSEAHDNARMVVAMERFIEAGVAMVAVTRGKDGCAIMTGSRVRFEESPGLSPSWASSTVMVEATKLPSGTVLNTNGAGDSFTAGLLTAALLRRRPDTDDNQEQSASTPSSPSRVQPSICTESVNSIPNTLTLYDGGVFANLIAAQHVDVSTRNAPIVNVSSLLTRACQ